LERRANRQSNKTGFSNRRSCDFMLSVRTTKALISDVPRIVSIDINACHANVINYFLYND